MLINGQSLNQSIPHYTEQLAPEEQGLCKAISFGVCRYYRSLAASIDPLLDKPLRNKDYDIYALLLVGAYQLDKMRTPEYAAIDSCVSACKILKKDWAKGLINAVLRKYQQQAAELKPDEKAATEHPDWLIGKLRKMWPEHSEAIFRENNAEPPLCLRINEKLNTRDEYCALLTQVGIETKPGKLVTSSVYLPSKGVNITELPGFSDGLFSVQDEAPQLAPSLLELAPGQSVLDACAAPGGKTCHILESEPQLAGVTAVDMDPQRLGRVTENLQRLGLAAQCIAADITATDHWWDGQQFDRILADVPCSATGVIRRHPDIKWLRQADDIPQLAALQLQMLKTLWDCLKPGGILLYATCSVLTQENSKVIKAFLDQESTAEHLAMDRDFGDSAIQCDFGVQLLPQANGHDGFYYAKLQKTDCTKQSD